MWFVDLACLLRLLGRFFMSQNPAVVHTFSWKSCHSAACRSRQWCHISTIELPNFVVTMKRFHWGRYIGCVTLLPYHQCCHCCFFSLDLGFFCFLWDSGVFIENLFFFLFWSNFRNVFSIQEYSRFTCVTCGVSSQYSWVGLGLTKLFEI